MKVFVSGAAGFLGKAVVAELAKRGHEVVGLVRTEEKGKLIQSIGGRYVVGDLMVKGPWMDEVQSSYRVVGLSFPVKFNEKLGMDAFIGRNVQHAKAVSNLIKAAKHGEARSIIITYDTLCLGDKPEKWVEEPGEFIPTGYCRPIGNTYDEIKRAGDDAGIPLVNIFPGRVYGPNGWFPHIVERIQKGAWNIAGEGDNHISVIHIDDLAWAYGEAVERLTRDESFALADGKPCTQADFVNYIADVLGVTRPKKTDYHTFAEAEGIMLAESLASSVMVSAAKATKLLDFVPKHADYKSGILAVLKTMGVMPKAEMKEKAA